jgi:hypothetical protein
METPWKGCACSIAGRVAKSRLDRASTSQSLTKFNYEDILKIMGDKNHESGHFEGAGAVGLSRLHKPALH